MIYLSIAETCICCGSRELESSPAVLMPFVADRALGHAPVEITSEWGLRDIRQGTSYMPCHSLQCRVCGALFLDYRFSDQQMASLYRGYRNESYNQERNYYEPGYAICAERDFLHRHPYIFAVEEKLAPYLPEQPVVLDWGGGSGMNTPFLGRAQIFVHDISDAPLVDGARRYHESARESVRPDLVVCSQVLEHVPSPINFLMEIVLNFPKLSLIYLEVPHEALIREFPCDRSLASRKRHWHEHINFFTKEALLQVVARAGLCAIETFTIEVDGGMMASEVFGVLARLK